MICHPAELKYEDFGQEYLQLLFVYLSQMLVFFNCAAGDESEDSYVPSLTQSKSTILRLQIPTEKSVRFAVRLRLREDVLAQPRELNIW